MAEKKKGKPLPVISNRRARREYEIVATFEAGIALVGTEVKSIRMGRANLQDAYAQIDKDGRVMLMNAHITPYDYGNRFNHESNRERQLLLHKSEIARLKAATQQKGMALVPLKMYFKRQYVKVQLGLARGKDLYDKRRDEKKRDSDREIQRAVGSFNRRLK